MKTHWNHTDQALRRLRLNKRKKQEREEDRIEQEQKKKYNEWAKKVIDCKHEFTYVYGNGINRYSKYCINCDIPYEVLYYTPPQLEEFRNSKFKEFRNVCS